MTAVQQKADLLAGQLDAPLLPGCASAERPTVPDAVARLRALAREPVAVASCLLAPGHFQDQISRSEADWVTEPLGGHPALAGIVIDGTAQPPRAGRRSCYASCRIVPASATAGLPPRGVRRASRSPFETSHRRNPGEGAWQLLTQPQI
jgi:hypothetical protein